MFKDPYFNLGLLIRIFLLLAVVPFIHVQWFIPFMQTTLLDPSLNPWQVFLSHDTRLLAFPYGLAMYVALMPGQLIALLIHLFYSALYIDNLLLGLSIFIWDLLLYGVLCVLAQHKKRSISLFYWLSPFVIYINYWHGQLDIIPVTLLMMAVLALHKGFAKSAGLVLCLAICAKLSMIIAAPILAVYLYTNRRVKSLFKPFVISGFVSFLILIAPYLMSQGFYTMVLHNPELSQLTWVAFVIDEHTKLFILPLAYLLFLYALWRMERMNTHLLISALGIGFFITLLLTQASIGWYLWIIPFLALHQSHTQSIFENILIFIFSCVLLVYGLFYYAGADLLFRPIHLNNYLSAQHAALLQSMHPWFLTFMDVCLAIFSLSSFIKGVKQNDYYRLSRKPIAVGISGDSGCGKDTLSAALCALLDENSVSLVSGDDYHRFDRYSPMWKFTTHLEPKANDLEKFTLDILNLLDGKSVISRHYDHVSGHFVRAPSISYNDVIIASGLHALYVEPLRHRYDLKIFLMMDESLRRFFKLQRDTAKRGQSKEKILATMERRLSDAEKYVYPQQHHADIIFTLSARYPNQLVDIHENVPIATVLTVRLKNSFYYHDLLRVLVGTCGLHVDTNLTDTEHEVSLTVMGDIDADEIASLAKILLPHMSDILAFKPAWQANMTGLMQLIVLLHLSQSLYMRLN